MQRVRPRDAECTVVPYLIRKRSLKKAGEDMKIGLVISTHQPSICDTTANETALNYYIDDRNVVHG
jgi:hypothetical protein